MSTQSSSPSSGIPFPQSKVDTEGTSPRFSASQVDQHPSLQSTQCGKTSENISTKDASSTSSQSFVTSGGRMSPPSLGHESGSEQTRTTTNSNASSSTSSYSITRGGLPSIRNLLNSVHHEGSSGGMSGKDLVSRFTLEHNRPTSPSSLQRSQKVGSSGDISGHAGPSSQFSVRSMSPPKRPPLAPSAYAHSHYMQPSGPSSNAYATNSRSELSSQRSASNVGHSPPSPSRRLRSQQPYSAGAEGNFSSSASGRAQGGRSAGPPAPLILHPTSTSMSAYDPSAGEEQIGGSLLAKRSIQAQKDFDSEEPPLSPAAIRRRHTVGAMDEGYATGLHPSSSARYASDIGGAVIAHEAKDSQSTPRTFQPGRLASPISHVPLESPTTPTATNPMAHRKGHEGRSSSGIRRERSMMALDREAPLPPPRVSSAVAVPLALRNEGPSAVPHHMYLQQSTQSTGSMPSLSSSISTASGGSDRARVHSMEGRFDNNNNQSHPPSAWHNHGIHGAGRTVSGSDSFASPQSSVWHSRSSTLDSIETTSSMASNPSSNSLSHHSHHAARHMKSGDQLVQEGPTTPRHYRADYNRDWRFPAQQHEMASRSPQQHSTQSSRTRHKSLTRPASSGQLSHYGEPMTAGHMPPSPFANLSLASPSSHGGSSSADAIGGGHLQYQQQHNIRPRAQTMTYTDRRIAPLPSHSVHAHAATAMQQSQHYPYSGHDTSSVHSASPKRSYSSHSVNSLPQRVSSMEIESHVENHGAGMFDFQPARRRLSSSGSRPSTATSTSAGAPGGTVIVSGANVPVGSGAGAAKYECGWCGKRFSRPSSLKIHHHSHTGEKPFVCNEPGCGRTFSVQSNLRRHQKSHTANSRKVNLLGTPSDQHEGQDLHNSSVPFGSRYEPKPVGIPIRASGHPVGQMGLSHSMSMPYVGAATGNHGQSGHAGSGSSLRSIGNPAMGSSIRAFSGDPHGFGGVRERKTSVSSSLAGDRTDEEEEYFDVENNDDHHGFGGNRAYPASINPSTKRPFSASTDTEMMQDIHEEVSGSSHNSNTIDDESRPATAGSVQTRFQGLLNPPRSAPSN